MAIHGSDTTIGFDPQDVFPEGDAARAAGFVVNTPVMAIDGFVYVYAKNGNSAISAGTPNVPEQGVPARAFYWRKAEDLKA